MPASRDLLLARCLERCDVFAVVCHHVFPPRIAHALSRKQPTMRSREFRIRSSRRAAGRLGSLISQKNPGRGLPQRARAIRWPAPSHARRPRGWRTSDVPIESGRLNARLQVPSGWLKTRPPKDLMNLAPLLAGLFFAPDHTPALKAREL